MYPITSAVKALFDSEQKQVLRITGTDKNGSSISITDENVALGGFGIDRYSCNGEKLEVGTAIAAQMTLKLNNVDGTFDGIVFEGAELKAEVGIADWSQTTPSVTYIPCGYFTPDEQPRRLNQISLTCLDRMTKFDVVVDSTALTLPDTVAGLVGQVCTICGVTLAQSISGLTNASVSITALPSVQGNMTYRNIIQWCAGIMATNAWMDWNGQLCFSWYDNSTSYEMTTANRFSSDLYEDDLTVTGAMYTNASGTEVVAGTDDYAIDLTGNALVGPLAATVMPAINTAVNGFVYRPFTAAVINAPYLWPMDEVTFTDKDGNDHASVLTNVAFSINGVTALESKGMTYAINARKQPKGITKEQAQIISEAMEAVENNIDEALTQQDIFNRLTDNGSAQGLFMTQDGQLYINLTYARSGTLVLGGLNNTNGTMQVLDASGNVVATVNNLGVDITEGSVISYDANRENRAALMTGGLFLQYYGQSAGTGQYGWLNTAALLRNGFYSYEDMYLYGRNGLIRIDNSRPSVPGDKCYIELDDGKLTLYSNDNAEIAEIILDDGVITLTGNNGTKVVLDDYSTKFYVNDTDLVAQIGDGVSTDDSYFAGALSVGDAATTRTNLGITPANIGAVAKSGDTMTGSLTVGQASDTVERQVMARSAAGRIYFRSEGSSTGIRGIYSYNAAGDGVAVMNLNQSNQISYLAPLLNRLQFVISNSDYSTAPSADTSVSFTQVFDDNSFVRHNVYAYRAPSNSYYTYIAARYPSSPSNTVCQIGVGITASGDPAYTVSHPGAFKSAIGLGNVNDSVVLTASDNTVAKIYAKLSALPITPDNGAGVTCWITAAAMNLLTGGKVTSSELTGVIVRTADTAYRIFGMYGLTGFMMYWGVTVTSTAITPNTVYKLQGTAM